MSKKGIGTADSKVEAVLKARAPMSCTELRSFLELVHNYGRLQPLNTLLKKCVKWE